MSEGRDTATGRYARGAPGRPKGAKGRRPALLRALDDLVADDAEDLISIVVNTAKNGDMRAMEILLKRLWPEPKGRPLEVAIPRLNGATSLTDAIAAIVAEVCKGALTPDEGHQVALLLDMQRRAHEVAGFDERLAKIERVLAELKHPTTRSED